MGVEVVKDSQGKEHMTVKVEELYDDEFMGNSLEDFDILQLLGKRDNRAVFKVASKINQKIYAMKKLDISKMQGNNAKQDCQNEIDTLKTLNHALVIKYYKSFFRDNCFYFVSEFMNNGDLNGVVNAYGNLKEGIEEEKLWNIFIQCMTGLVYIHSKGIIHKNIKLENIFINNDGDVKIGDFGLAEKITPYPGKNNSKEKDIQDMGVVFSTLLNFGGLKNQNKYQRDLYDIVSKMNQPIQNNLDSNKILNILKEGYSKKYEQNSSISSILSCLFTNQKFVSYFTAPKQKKYLTDNLQIKPISYSVLISFEVLLGRINQPWFKLISYIRELLAKENKSYGGREEIEPRRILFYILEKMHQEVKNSNSNINLKKKNSLDDYTFQNKMEAFTYFNNLFQTKDKSPISDYFFGIMKTKKECGFCKKDTYSFNLFSYVSFNLSLLPNNNSNTVNILDCFHLQNQKILNLEKDKLIYCKYCKAYQNHHEAKQFFSMPFFLIICFDRGTDCSSKININISETLDLGKEVDGQTSLKKFKLTGIIKRINKNNKEHYISLYFDYTKGCWVIRDDDNIQKINSLYDHQTGFIIMMFYNSIDDNNNINNNINNMSINFFNGYSGNEFDMNLSQKMKELSINNNMNNVNNNINFQ